MLTCTDLAASIQASGLSGAANFLILTLLFFTLGWLAVRKRYPAASKRDESEAALSMIIGAIMVLGGAPLGGDWDDAMSVDGDLWYSTADRAPF